VLYNPYDQLMEFLAKKSSTPARSLKVVANSMTDITVQGLYLGLN